MHPITQNFALVFAAVMVFALSGCTEQAEPVQTVDWYKEHKEEREAMVQRCQNNPGEIAMTPNCINSVQAASDIQREEISSVSGRVPQFKPIKVN